MLRFAQFRLLQAFREHHSLTVSPAGPAVHDALLPLLQIGSVFQFCRVHIDPTFLPAVYVPGILDYSREFLRILGTLCHTPRTLSHIPAVYGRYGLFTVYQNTITKPSSSFQSTRCNRPGGRPLAQREREFPGRRMRRWHRIRLWGYGDCSCERHGKLYSAGVRSENLSRHKTPVHQQ